MAYCVAHEKNESELLLTRRGAHDEFVTQWEEAEMHSYMRCELTSYGKHKLE